MTRAVFTPQRARIELLLWRHGWALPLAAALVALAAALQVFGFRPDLHELIEQSARRIQAGLDRIDARAGEPLDEARQLEGVRASLGGRRDPTALIRRLGELAQAEKIAIAQAEYQQRFMPATSLLHIQVTQPVTASYPQARRYVEAVLREMPNASLDQIAVRRDNVGQSRLEVRLRWSFWIPSTP
jgi:hypothetical protein